MKITAIKNKILPTRALIVICIACVTLYSCRKEETPPLLRIPVTNLRFTVDATLQPPFTYYIPVNQVKPNALALINARGIDTSEITSIRPRRATLSVVFGESRLDFLEAVSIRLCPLGQNQENCGKEAFFRDPVPFDAGIDLDLSPSAIKDMKDILLMETINVQVKVERLRGFPNGTFDVNLDMEFDVR